MSRPCSGRTDGKASPSLFSTARAPFKHALPEQSGFSPAFRRFFPFFSLRPQPAQPAQPPGQSEHPFPRFRTRYAIAPARQAPVTTRTIILGKFKPDHSPFGKNNRYLHYSPAAGKICIFRSSAPSFPRPEPACPKPRSTQPCPAQSAKTRPATNPKSHFLPAASRAFSAAGTRPGKPAPPALTDGIRPRTKPVRRPFRRHFFVFKG